MWLGMCECDRGPVAAHDAPLPCWQLCTCCMFEAAVAAPSGPWEIVGPLRVQGHTWVAIGRHAQASCCVLSIAYAAPHSYERMHSVQALMCHPCGRRFVQHACQSCREAK